MKRRQAIYQVQSSQHWLRMPKGLSENFNKEIVNVTKDIGTIKEKQVRNEQYNH